MTCAPAPVRPAPTGSGPGVLLAVGAVVTVGVLPVFLLGGLAVQVRAELGVPARVVGLAVALFFGTSAVAARPLSRVTERLGPTAAMRIAALGSGAALLGVAAAPSTPWLLAALVGAALPAALSQPASNEMLMARVPVGRRGIAFAVKQSAIPVSTLVAGAAVPAVALTVGWRWAFVAAAVLAGVAALTVPRLPWPRAARPDRAARSRASGPVLVALAAAMGLGAAAANGMGSFVTLSAVEVGYGEAAAGVVLLLASATGLAARLLAGAVADRTRPDLLRVVTAMLGLGAAGLALLALGRPGTFLVGLLVAFGAGWAWPGLFNQAVAARFPDRVAAATAVTQTGVYAGAALGPLAFGVLLDTAGPGAAFAAAAAVMLLAAALLVAARRSPRLG